MQELRLQLVAKPTSADLQVVRDGMRRYTQQHVPWEVYDELTLFLRDDDDVVVGAALGQTGRGWLHVSVIWVDERYRRKGYGAQLLAALEAEARQRGCHHAYLDTFSYQARPFYDKYGYQVFGTLQDYPEGHQRFFMSKSLDRI